jgi:hypothetical protein
MVLNYNGLKWIPTCLASVAKTEYENFSVYLVDNGSTDGSVDYVKSSFPRVKIIQHPTNLGFAEGYNRAVEEIEADCLVLLNNDTEVLNPGWVKELVNVAGTDPEIAAVACKIVSMENHSCLDSVGGMGIPFWRGFVDVGHGEPDRGQYDVAGFEPFAFCGGAALVRLGAFRRLGGFDGSLFMYVEDADLSWRMRLSGYRIGYASKARVAHYLSGSASSREIDARKLYYCHRNLLATILRNCGSSLRWAFRNYFLFSFMMIAGFSIYEPEKSIAAVKAIIWNILNLRDTCIRRLRIQADRVENEAEILISMYPRLTRHQPAQHATLRHMLNILFEYSQLSRLSSWRR